MTTTNQAETRYPVTVVFGHTVASCSDGQTCLECQVHDLHSEVTVFNALTKSYCYVISYDKSGNVLNEYDNTLD